MAIYGGIGEKSHDLQEALTLIDESCFGIRDTVLLRAALASTSYKGVDLSYTNEHSEHVSFYIPTVEEILAWGSEFGPERNATKLEQYRKGMSGRLKMVPAYLSFGTSVYVRLALENLENESLERKARDYVRPVILVYNPEFAFPTSFRDYEYRLSGRPEERILFVAGLSGQREYPLKETA